MKIKLNEAIPLGAIEAAKEMKKEYKEQIDKELLRALGEVAIFYHETNEESRSYAKLLEVEKLELFLGDDGWFLSCDLVMRTGTYGLNTTFYRISFNFDQILQYCGIDGDRLSSKDVYIQRFK